MLVGIDLGTTNSLVAVWQDGGPQLIPNALGEVLTPSAVCVTDKHEILVGRAARDRCFVQPASGAMTFKRFMGTERAIAVGDQYFRPEELSALVLKSLKADAERFLGQAVNRAVITVPAYFSDAQRKATRIAGELARLNVERLINEPTAAALAYGLLEQPAESTFLVLDLGGGTFDVSILERFDGVMEVRASTGDNYLGGEDFVEVLVHHLLSVWKELPGKSLPPTLRARLWSECERVKRQLGNDDTVSCIVEWEGKAYQHRISAIEFEHLAEPLLKRFRLPIERALRDAKLRPSDLDEIVLAGGATRMPIIRRLVARLFGRMPAMQLNPDEVVARGAAVMVGLIERKAELEEVVMTDVCPYTMGTEVGMRMDDGTRRDGFYSPIIERNTVVPVSREESYCTSSDNQARVYIGIYQGEARLVKDNIQLGELKIEVPPRKAGEVTVLVRFTYDVSGLLEVEVKVPETGAMERLVLERHPGVMNEAEIADKLARLSALKIHPRDQQINAALLARAERLHEELLGRSRQKLAAAINSFETALATQDETRIHPARAALEEVMRTLEQGACF
jgi:molecular chaperone HscC